jgi:hypothetical protein
MKGYYYLDTSAQVKYKGYDAVQVAATLRLQQTLGSDRALVFVAGDKTVTTAAESEGLTVDNPFWHVEESE